MIGKITIDYDNEKVYLFDHTGLLLKVREGDRPQATTISFEELATILKFYTTVLRMRAQEQFL